MNKLIIYIIIILLFCGWKAEDFNNPKINYQKIIMIESGGNRLAYNKHTQAIGLMGITPICLKHFNKANNKKYKLGELFIEEINIEVGVWYIGWIKEQLKEMKLLTVDNVLICYNWGLGNFKKYIKGEKKLPEETENYLWKYYKG